MVIYQVVIFEDRELDIYKEAPNGCYYTCEKGAEKHMNYIKTWIKNFDVDIKKINVKNQF